MNATDAYERWLAARRDAGVPPGFAEHVMDAVAAPAPLGRLWRSPAVRGVTWTAAAVVLALRLAALALVFLTGCAS